MTNLKRKFSALLAGALVAGTLLGEAVPVYAAGVKETGYENGYVVDMEKISSYVSGYSNKDGGVAEIIAYDTVNKNAWVVNGATGKLDILALADENGISETMTATTLDIQALVEGRADGFVYGDMTSVAINSRLGIAAIALQAEGYDKNGYVALLTTDGTLITMFEAGCQPDNVVFTPDGTKILSANEGEPREGFGEGVVDPAGSVTIIEVNMGDYAASTVTTLDFSAFDSQAEELLANNILMVKDNVPSKDFEPEYIAATNNTAYIALQENNATEYCNEIKTTLIATDGTEAKKVRVLDPETTAGLPEGKSVLYGGRSFSMYQVTDAGLTLVYNSGSDFEAKTAGYFPDYFNCSNDDNEYDSRSPKKGPEPESVTIGTVDGRTYAFVALERIGGIMVYDITNPEDVISPEM